MLTLLKYIVQLILSPSHGWEDIERENPSPEKLMRSGLLTLLGIAVCTEFLSLLNDRDASISATAIRAIADFGAYFVSVYIAKLIFDIYMKRIVGENYDNRRASVLAIMAVGLMIFFQIIDNILPWNLILLRFLPLYAVLVIYKSSSYMHVPTSDEMNFLILASTATIAVPMAIHYLFSVIIP